MSAGAASIWTLLNWVGYADPVERSGSPAHAGDSTGAVSRRAAFRPRNPERQSEFDAQRFASVNLQLRRPAAGLLGRSRYAFLGHGARYARTDRALRLHL